MEERDGEQVVVTDPIAASGQSRNEIIDIAGNVFDLSQSLRKKWLAAGESAKRRILAAVSLNGSLDEVSLVATSKQPFDLLARGLLQQDRWQHTTAYFDDS